MLDMWTLTLFIGLPLVGLALVGTGTSNVLGALVLAMGSFGWAYRFTDNSSLFEIGQPTSPLRRTRGASKGQPESAKSERAAEANPEQGGRPEDVVENTASDGQSEAAYLDEVADIQNRSVEASLRSNNKLLRYDGLTAEDVEELKADYVALENYARRARDLAPSAEHDAEN